MLIDYDAFMDDATDMPTYSIDRHSAVKQLSTQVLLLANDLTEDCAISSSLRDAACDVSRVGSIENAIAQARLRKFGVIVVDLRPDVFGYQAVRQLRMANIDLPVLFVSARSSVDAIDCAYTAGADDVAPFPLARKGLKARILSLAVRAETAEQCHTIKVGRMEMDAGKRNARIDGKALPLSSQEYDVLELLVASGGAPIGKSAIFTAVRSDKNTAFPEMAVTMMTGLRRKLEKAAADEFIHPVRGLGYALNNNAVVHICRA